MKKIKKLSSRKYKIVGISSLILVGGIVFSLSRQTPQINMAEPQCTDYNAKESCQSAAGCYWDGEKSEGGGGCKETQVPAAIGFSQLGFSTPKPKSIISKIINCDTARKLKINSCHRSCPSLSNVYGTGKKISLKDGERAFFASIPYDFKTTQGYNDGKTNYLICNLVEDVTFICRDGQYDLLYTNKRIDAESCKVTTN